MTDTPDIEVPPFLAAATARKCSNCMWWQKGENKWGVCRGGPPHMGQGYQIARWPWTANDDWCGSFRMKDPGHE